MSKNKVKSEFKIIKQYKEDYRGYRLYVVVDAAKQEHWMAESDWLTSGCITCVGSSNKEVKSNIDAVHARIKLLSTLRSRQH